MIMIDLFDMGKKTDQHSKDFARSLGALLKRERENKGIKQIDVANKLGHNSSVMVCRYERGAMIPSAHTLFVIAQILDITIEIN